MMLSFITPSHAWRILHNFHDFLTSYSNHVQISIQDARNKSEKVFPSIFDLLILIKVELELHCHSHQEN